MYNIPIYYLDKIEKEGKVSFTEIELQEALNNAYDTGFSNGYNSGYSYGKNNADWNTFEDDYYPNDTLTLEYTNNTYLWFM